MTDQQVLTTANQSKVGATAGLYLLVSHRMYTIDYMTLWFMNEPISILFGDVDCQLGQKLRFYFWTHFDVEAGPKWKIEVVAPSYFEVGCGFRVDFCFETSIFDFTFCC